nr:adenylate/guanylate cyclase domain-containing protein [Nocardioides flavescens]
MTCDSCGTSNPAGQRFCGECGTALARSCPTCGAAAPAGQRFCGECGHALAGAPATPPAPLGPATPVSERRVCSVLFADLVGFTTASEGRDPEDVRDLLSAYFASARTVVERYGGVVEKFIGDAVMAVWGTPVAREGDAERSVRAALDLVAAVAELGEAQQPLSLRAGIVTGEVAVTVGAVGEGMVAGDVVNTAARVQATARPGHVWVDETTQRLTAAAIGYSPAGSHALKGKAAPVELWEATRVQANVGGARRIDGLEAPLVGRQATERSLRELFHATADRSVPALVVVSGPAGSGKSRLGWELEKYTDGLADRLLWHRGRCLAYGDGIAYGALAEAVRQRLGIGEDLPADAASQRLVEQLAELVPDEARRAFAGVRLARLLGLAHPDDPGGTLERDDLFAGWRLFFEQLAASAPVVLVVEDAQHADDGLLDFLEHLVDWARQVPVHVVVMAREELLERRPGLGLGRHRTTLPLEALDEASMRALVTALVRDLPEQAVTAIVAQAEGNPLFAVETVRSLIDRDAIVPIGGAYHLVGEIGTLTVPDSLHGLLAARLDALAPGLRALVADAAVLGPRFSGDALAGVSERPREQVEQGLAELVRRGVLDVSADPLAATRHTFTFGQGMLRSVAYATLSRRDRKARHLAVAAHLHDRAFRGEDVAEVVAQHYLDALEASSATDPDRADIAGRALDSLVRGAERASRSGAPERAGSLLHRAAGLVVDTDPARAAELSVQASLSWAHAGDHPRALSAAEEGAALSRRLDEPRAVAAAQVHQVRALRMLGRLAEARELYRAVSPQLRERPDLDTVELLGQACATEAFLGDGTAARALAEESLGLAQQLDAPLDQIANLFLTQGIAHLFSHRVQQGLASFTYAGTLADRVGATSVATRAALNVSGLLTTTDPAAALEAAGRAAELARLHGHRESLATAVFNGVVARLATGTWAAARAELDVAMDDNGLEHGYLLALRVVLTALAGDLDAAVELSAGLDELRRSDDVQDVGLTRWVDAVLASESGDARAALAALLTPGDGLEVVDESVCWSFAVAARAGLEAGDADGVRTLRAQLDAALDDGAPPTVLRGDLAAVDALLLAAAAAPDDEVEAASLRAVARLRAASFPHQLAHGLLDRAGLLVSTGRDPGAELTEAVLIAETLGAADLRRRARVLGVPELVAG